MIAKSRSCCMRTIRFLRRCGSASTRGKKIMSFSGEPHWRSAASAWLERDGHATCGGFRSAGNDQLDLSVVSTRRKFAGRKPGEAIHRNIFPGRVRLSQIVKIDDVLQRLGQNRYQEFLRVPRYERRNICSTGRSDRQPISAQRRRDLLRGSWQVKDAAGKGRTPYQPRRCDLRRKDARTPLPRHHGRIDAAGDLCPCRSS